MLFRDNLADSVVIVAWLAFVFSSNRAHYAIKKPKRKSLEIDNAENEMRKN